MKLSLSQQAAVLVASGSPLVNAALYDQVVHTKYGDIQGYPALNGSTTENYTNWKDITVWKGIPFAASTAYQNRWKPPQPVEPWNTTLNAKTFGPVCPSTNTNDGYEISEDCLSLNIWSSANSSSAKQPVALWSYPAGASGRDALFNGAGMADEGVVMVTYNYRNGAFGWLASPELSEERFAETGHNSSGNWGVLDQFAALKWIHANIEAFGGDPNRITVMGQSAGSAATYHIVNSPLTKGLISGAIIESGVRDPHDPLAASVAENYVSLETNLAQGTSYLNSLNLTSIEQARKLPYTSLPSSALCALLKRDTCYDWRTTLDYYTLPSTYMESLQSGAANDVPIITGNTKDESGASYGVNITLSTYLSDLNTTYNGTWASRFLEQYPANDSATASAAYNAQWTDRSKVGTWLWSQLWAKTSSQPVYTYIWDHAPPGQDQGAYHESEINYVLNNLYDTDKPWTAEDYAIAKTMNAYWVNFIKTGNPNGEGLVKWEKTSEEPKVMRVGNGFERIDVASEGQVKLFEEWFAGLKAY